METANANIASICQIGAVKFASGRATEVWHSLINPEEPFAAWNVSIHGIDELAVNGAPDFPSFIGTLSSVLAGMVVASHMPFDRIAIQRACCKYRVPPVQCFWLDTARVARRAWPRFAKKGYGLKSVADWCGIEFCHHNAVDDAKTAGQILARAVLETGINLEGWLDR